MSVIRRVAPFLLILVLAVVPARAQQHALTFDEFISLGRVSDPQVSPDGKMVAFVVSYEDMEANKGNSDIYIMPIKGGDAKQLTYSPKTDKHPRFSADGKWIAFRSSRSGKNQIWLLPVAGGEPRQLTSLSTGATSPEWTPDGATIIFRSRVYADCPDDDCNKQRDEDKADDKVTAQVYDRLFYRHWDEWADGKVGHLFSVSLSDESVSQLTTGAQDFPTGALGSSHDVAVSPDGKELCIAANDGSSLENNINNDLYLLPLAGGDLRVITANAANDNYPVYSPDGKYIAYRAMSRPGFEADQYRLMLYDRVQDASIDIGEQLATEFDRSVSSIAWAPDSKSIYVTASDMGFVSIYSVSTKDGKTRQLTEHMYVNSLTVTPNGKTLVFLKQSSLAPYELYTANKDGKKAKQLTHTNDEALAAVDMKPMEPFSFEGAEGTTVHGFMMKPPGYEEGKKYPLVFLIHGGPQGAWSDNFHWRWNYQMFASPGYAVSIINPRGSTGYGQKFTDEITGDWGGKPYTDLMNGLDYILENYDYVDADRIGAAGGSYGGYMINWIATQNDRFNTLVNHDGLFNLESFYGTTEELWFPEWEFDGTPYENREEFLKHSPHMYAKNIKTPMLVIHGGQDYRVDPSEGFQTFTALQRQGVPSKLLYFPDEGHWVLKPQNAQLWWSTVHEWLGDSLDPRNP